MAVLAVVAIYAFTRAISTDDAADSGQTPVAAAPTTEPGPSLTATTLPPVTTGVAPSSDSAALRLCVQPKRVRSR